MILKGNSTDVQNIATKGAILTLGRVQREYVPC